MQKDRERYRESRWREREVWESSQQGDSSQDGRKLLMLFFSNPFLISGFGTRVVGEDKVEVGRERKGERQKWDPN